MKNPPNSFSKQCKISNFWTLNIDHKNTKCSSNPKDVLKLTKNFSEKLYTKEGTSKSAKRHLRSSKFLRERKSSSDNITFLRLGLLWKKFLNQLVLKQITISQAMTVWLQNFIKALIKKRITSQTTSDLGSSEIRKH